MIARFKIGINFLDILETVKRNSAAIKSFEKEFALKFRFKYAFSYAYGRSALKFLLESTSIRNSEVILSGYTCSVVAHAVVLSGNNPVFVDIGPKDFNPSIQSICKAINSKTRFIILSHTFGFPQDSKKLQNEVIKYEKKFNHKIWLINDCAHSFDASNQNIRVMDFGDATIFGLNISKTITSIFGGITATNNKELAERIIRRNSKFKQISSTKREIYQRLYIVLAFIAFKSFPYKVTKILLSRTKLLSKLTDSYHLDGIIHFPKDYKDGLTLISAQIGLRQLNKYDEIVKNRIDNSKIFETELIESELFDKPRLIQGSTFSHYPVRVRDKDLVRKEMLKFGIECGEVIQYSIPELEIYKRFATGKFPNAARAAESVINLPINYSSKKTKYISECFNSVISNLELSINEQK